MDLYIPKAVKPAVDFAVQVVFGAIAFLVVLIVAVIISSVVKALDGYMPDWMHPAADVVEKGLFWVDLICFVLFVLSEVLKLIRGILSEWSAP